MTLFSFIKKLAIGALLLQGQMQAGAVKNKTNGKFLLEDGTAHPVNDDTFFNPCEDLGFHLAAGKATRNTTRWLLGEFHPEHDKTEKCIKRLTAPPGKTSVYIEGLDFRISNVKCEDHFKTIKTQTNLECLGWDNIDARYEEDESDPELAFFVRMVAERNVYFHNKLSDSAFKKYLERVALVNVNDEGLKKIYPEKHLEKEVMHLRKTANRLLNERKKTKSFDELFNRYITGPNIPQIKKESQYIRNKALIDTLRAHPNDHRSITIAGRDHLFPIKGDNNPNTRDYVNHALKSDEEKSSYAILEYKRKK
jgi:hypothetical protein